MRFAGLKIIRRFAPLEGPVARVLALALPVLVLVCGSLIPTGSFSRLKPAEVCVDGAHPGSTTDVFLHPQKKPARKTNQAKWKLDCIVLDAGHGGHDPGAIGTKGTKEKKVTLGIVLKLGALIKENMPDVRVVYTRKDDRFIELDQRGKIANSAGGKLFISVHCNSSEEKPTKVGGFEVYLLRPGRTDEAMRIAEFENSVIKLEKDYEKRYQQLTDEQFIVINMAQSAYMKYSEHIAELLHREIKKSKIVKSLGVKQAGFYVLVGASMPNVLVESAFLSNLKEEQFLASSEGQAFFARKIFAGIEQYAKDYAKSQE
jgi:N-acetylmuramoyl-L-alanine amidase